MNSITSILGRVLRRLDAEALDQLRSEAVRLAKENDRLRDTLATGYGVTAQLQAELADAQRTIDQYHDDWLDLHRKLCEVTNGGPGLTQDGRLVVLQGAVT